MTRSGITETGLTRAAAQGERLLRLLSAEALEPLRALAERMKVPLSTIFTAGLAVLAARHSEERIGRARIDSRHPATPPVEVELAKGLTLEQIVRIAARQEWENSQQCRVCAELGDLGDLGFQFGTDIEGAWLAPESDREEVRAVARRLRPLLVGACGTPDLPVSRLPLLTRRERETILGEWNATRWDFGGAPACVHGLFERQAALRPGARAVMCDGRVWTYGQLNARANRIAHYLRSQGVGRGALVGVCVDRSEEMIAAVLGVLKSGAAYVPLDPDYPTDRLMMMLEDAGRPLLLTQTGLADALHAGAHGVVLLDEPGLLEAMPEHDPAAGTTGDDRAYVIYTSGSTGKPKGVQVLHRNVVNLMCSMRNEPGIAERDRFLTLATLCFDMSVVEVLLPLSWGASLAVAPRAVQKDGVRLKEYVERSGATVMQATPATFRMLISAGWNGHANLKILCGGEAVPAALAEQLLPRSGELWNMYGPTETTVWSTGERVTERTLAGGMTVGRPIANTQVYLLDPEMQPVPPGMLGEIYIGGAGVSAGYLNRAALTAERFVRSPFGERGDDRLYRTGDVARFLPDGRIDFVGRNDHQVKIKGYRIELGEIEEALLRQDGVRQAAVLAVEREPGADKRLVAYLVTAPGTEANPSLSARLKEGLSKRLPAYMVPSAFVTMESGTLPLTPNGKVDRKALARVEAPAGDPATPARANAVAENPLEDRVLKVLQRVLKVSELGVTDDFFEAGGDSLMAVDLAVQLEREFGRMVPLTSLIPEASARAVAGVLSDDRTSAGADRRGADLVVHAGAALPPLFCIPGAGGHAFMYREMAELLDPDRPVYGMNYPGTDGTSEAVSTVEGLAAHFIARIRAVRPEGPYHLGGYSLGGVVAYEMARQLRRDGHAVGEVLLFDTFGPGYPAVMPPVRRAVEHLRHMWTLPPGQRGAYAARFAAGSIRHARRAVERQLQRRGRAPAPSPAVERHLPASVSDVVTRVNRSALDAERTYTFPAYDGHVSLIRAAKTPHYVGMSYDDPYNGWTAVARGDVDAVNVDADHVGMWKPPAVADVARAVADRLGTHRDPHAGPIAAFARERTFANA